MPACPPPGSEQHSLTEKDWTIIWFTSASCKSCSQLSILAMAVNHEKNWTLWELNPRPHAKQPTSMYMQSVHATPVLKAHYNNEMSIKHHQYSAVGLLSTMVLAIINKTALLKKRRKKISPGAVPNKHCNDPCRSTGETCITKMYVFDCVMPQPMVDAKCEEWCCTQRTTVYRQKMLDEHLPQRHRSHQYRCIAHLHWQYLALLPQTTRNDTVSTE